MARRGGERPLASRVRSAARASLAFLFSNVGVVVLVAGYTIAGGFMFQAIEGASEMERSSLMARERDNTVQYLWHNVTLVINPLNETLIKDRMGAVVLRYQRRVVRAARRGWAGGHSSRQWSFSNAFLYSMTVITTIGYGHLSPRTNWGKVATIFYALLGMPLFLLYLSNVGSLLARWCKCVYSLLCLCRGCRGVRRRRGIATKHQLEISEAESIENGVKWRRHSDSDLSQNNQPKEYRKPLKPQPKSRYSADGDIPYRIRPQNKYTDQRVPIDSRYMVHRAQFRQKVLDFRDNSKNVRSHFRDSRINYKNHIDLRRRPLDYSEQLSEKFKTIPSHRKQKSRDSEWYEMERRYRYIDIGDSRNMPHPYRQFQRKPDYRSSSAPHWRSDGWSGPANVRREFIPPDGGHYWPRPLAARRGRSLPAPPPRGSASGSGSGSGSGSSDFSYVSFDAQTITVPISVCVIIMVGYLVFGSMLFGLWEQWDLLDGAYFCFISLTSIGFGDFVPGERVYTPRIETSFVVCSLYLMLGMALVAMCFNLMQEQVIHYFAGLKRAVKRICRCQCNKRQRRV